MRNHLNNQSVSEILDGSDIHPKEAPEFHAESTPRASTPSKLETPYELSTSPENIDDAQLYFGPLPETQSNVFDPQVQVSRQQSGLSNELGLELGETVIKSDEQATPTNPSHPSPPISHDAEGNHSNTNCCRV